MLWVYDHHKYAYTYIAGIDFRRQNLPSTFVRLTTKVDGVSKICSNSFFHVLKNACDDPNYYETALIFELDRAIEGPPKKTPDVYFLKFG